MSGGGGAGGEGGISSSFPFALSPSHTLHNRAFASHRHQWSLEEGGDRRLGQGGGVGVEEGGGAGGRQGQRPTDAGYAEQQPGTQSFLLPARGSVSSRVSFAGPGRGLSPGPPEDDVDLSVLHALGRSGCFSWGVAPPAPYPSSESPFWGGVLV